MSPQFLDDNLIMEILSWLQVKPLMRFRCVCKSWKSLISEPQLAKLQLQRSSNKNADFTDIHLLYQYYNFSSRQTHVSSCSVSSLLKNPSCYAAKRHYVYPLKFEVRFFGTCNGLISLLSKEHDCYKVSLWNPSLNLMSQESPPLYNKDIDFYNFGFGYDCLSDTYKVVAVGRHGAVVKIYNMSASCWRSVQCFPAFPNLFREPDGVYVNNTLNWLGTRENNLTQMKTDRYLIVSFDLRKEKYELFSLPYRHKIFIHLTPIVAVLRDCLCISEHSYLGFVIWQMKKFGVHESWNQLLNISFACSIRGPLVPLSMSENDDVMLLAECEGVLFLLNWREDRLVRHKFVPEKCYCYNVQTYIGSLVLPD